MAGIAYGEDALLQGTYLHEFDLDNYTTAKGKELGTKYSC